MNPPWGALSRRPRGNRLTLVLRILYWLAVLLVSLALLIALVLFLESRDESSLSEGVIVVPWPGSR